jgi:hypothetical protein
LRETHDSGLRVFVIWEPVLVTDWRAPSASSLGRVPDARVVQFWDPGRALSSEIRRAAEADPSGVLGNRHLYKSIVWDFVGMYPQGVRWDGAFPAARFAGGPVVGVIDGFRRALGIAGG